MTSSRRVARALALAASVALIMAGLVLQPVAAISNGSSLVWLEQQPTTAEHRRHDHEEIGNPNGTAIAVEILNGSGDRVRKAGIPIELVIQTGRAAGTVLENVSRRTATALPCSIQRSTSRGSTISSSPRPRTVHP